MIFYTLHHINQYLIPWSKETSEGRKNILTFIFGAVLYFLVYGVLKDDKMKSIVENNVVLSVFGNFFIYFVIVDIIAVAGLYKNYFNRSILHEAKEIALAPDGEETGFGTNLKKEKKLRKGKLEKEKEEKDSLIQDVVHETIEDQLSDMTTPSKVP
jgi:hypothetical protein